MDSSNTIKEFFENIEDSKEKRNFEYGNVVCLRKRKTTFVDFASGRYKNGIAHNIRSGDSGSYLLRCPLDGGTDCFVHCRKGEA